MFEADRSLGCSRWNVIRLPAGTTTEVVLLSTRFFCLTTHFQGLSIVCPGEDCALCQILPSRGLFYLACFCMSQIRILELGALSASHLEQHCKMLHGGLVVGQVIGLKRRGAKTPVHSEVLRFQEGAKAVTQLDLAKHVMAIYKFPPPNPTESLESYEERLRGIAVYRAKMNAGLRSEKSRDAGSKVH